jgi:hypothetical protein
VVGDDEGVSPVSGARRRASLPKAPFSWSRHLIAALIAISLFVALGAWAVTSPVGSSPDDDFHLPSIWCALGDRPGLCAPGDTEAERLVPQGLLSASCYASPWEVISAECLPPLGAADQLELAPTTRGNFTGLYPPIYYSVVGIFASRHIELSVILIRLFNIAVFLASAVALFLVLPRKYRVPLVLGWAASIVQLGMFILSSDNPSSWALVSAGGLWLAVAGYLESSGGKRVALGAIAAVLTVMGAGARADSAIYSALSVCVAVFLTTRRERGFWRPRVLWLPVALVVVSALLYRAASQGDDAIGGLGAGVSPSQLSGHDLLLSNLLQLPKLYLGAFGFYGPTSGWTVPASAAPAIVWAPAFAVYAAILGLGLASFSWRKGLALVAVGTALVAIPLFILQAGRHDVGLILQPRYLLPLMLIFAGLAWFPVADKIAMPSRIQVFVGCAVLAVANGVALFANAKRFALGTSEASFNLNAHHVWWWHSGVPAPLFVVGMGAGAFALALFALATRYHSPLAKQPAEAR